MNFREPKFDTPKIQSLLYNYFWVCGPNKSYSVFDYRNETPSWPHNLFQVDRLFNLWSADAICGEQENNQIN